MGAQNYNSHKNRFIFQNMTFYFLTSMVKESLIIVKMSKLKAQKHLKIVRAFILLGTINPIETT